MRAASASTPPDASRALFGARCALSSSTPRTPKTTYTKQSAREHPMASFRIQIRGRCDAIRSGSHHNGWENPLKRRRVDELKVSTEKAKGTTPPRPCHRRIWSSGRRPLIFQASLLIYSHRQPDQPACGVCRRTLRLRGPPGACSQMPRAALAAHHDDVCHFVPKRQSGSPRPHLNCKAD